MEGVYCIVYIYILYICVCTSLYIFANVRLPKYGFPNMYSVYETHKIFMFLSKYIS